MCKLVSRTFRPHVNIAFFVYFLVRPRATILSNTLKVSITRPVNLTCKVYGFPKPEVSWLKDGQKIENDNHYNISLYGNRSNLTWYSNLRIENTRRNDTANYTCFLRNAAGTDEDIVSFVVLGNFWH